MPLESLDAWQENTGETRKRRAGGGGMWTPTEKRRNQAEVFAPLSIGRGSQ